MHALPAAAPAGYSHKPIERMVHFAASGAGRAARGHGQAEHGRGDVDEAAFQALIARDNATFKQLITRLNIQPA